MPPTTTIETVTPARARELLATSAGNRRIRADYVATLAAAMGRGEWVLTHQGLAIDSNGHLRDGHHRCEAIIASGVPCEMPVVRDLDPAAVTAMDIGVRRSFADIFGLDKRVAEPLRFAIATTRARIRITPAQVQPLIGTPFHAVLEDLVAHCGATRRYFSASPMRCAVTVCALENDRDFAFAQYRALVIADYDAMSGTARSLAKQVNTGGLRTVLSDYRDILARGLKVFSGERKDLSKIQINNGDTADAVARLRECVLRYVQTA